MAHQVLLFIFLLLSPSVLAGRMGRNIRGSSVQRQLEYLGYHWAQVGPELIGENRDDSFGNDVAMNEAGDIIAIGARNADSPNAVNTGHVRVFELDKETKTWVQKGSDIDGEAEGDRSGESVSLNAAGNIIAIAANFNDNAGGEDSGHARVYKFNDSAGDWEQMGLPASAIESEDLDGTDTNERMGSVVLSADGTRVVLGASGFPYGSFLGRARVFDYDEANNKWTQKGNSIFGTKVGDRFGGSVAISNDGSRIAVGSYAQDCNLEDLNDNCGSTRVFEFSDEDGIWVQIGSTLMGAGYKSHFGSDLDFSADGNLLAVGAARYAMYTGYTEVYRYKDGDWMQVGNSIPGESTYDMSGFSVSLSTDGSKIAIGAWGNKDAGSSSGHVRVFGYHYETDSWKQIGADIQGRDRYDEFGWAVAMNGAGTRIVAGSPGKVGADTTYKGGARVFEYAEITLAPSSMPSIAPSVTPTASPSVAPSPSPSATPSSSPSSSPTSSPSGTPTGSPTSSPTSSPTTDPSPAPTMSPTLSPTTSPTPSPTSAPSDSPTASPTKSPTSSPTDSPTASPTAAAIPVADTPTAAPTQVPLEPHWIRLGEWVTALTERFTKWYIDTTTDLSNRIDGVLGG